MALIGTDYTDSHSDEEDSFLNESLKIIKDLEAGEEVTHRVDELIIPQNASNGVITFVYNALKEISYSQSRENNEYHNLSRHERSCIPRLQLNDPRSLSSTDDLPLYSQRATFRAHKRIQTPEYDVLSVDDRSQRYKSHRDVSVVLNSYYKGTSRSQITITDFIYLFIFIGFICIIIFVFYPPNLHRGPVF